MHSEFLGPIIDADYIQDFLVFDVACNGDNTGSIVLGDPTDPDFLNAITSVTPGSVQISEIDFAPSSVVTYTDIFRVYINGTEYIARGGETAGGLNFRYDENDIINDLINRINNDPAQQDVTASLNGFGLRLQGTVEGVSFTRVSLIHDIPVFIAAQDPNSVVVFYVYNGLVFFSFFPLLPGSFSLRRKEGSARVILIYGKLLGAFTREHYMRCFCHHISC